MVACHRLLPCWALPAARPVALPAGVCSVRVGRDDDAADRGEDADPSVADENDYFDLLVTEPTAELEQERLYCASRRFIHFQFANDKIHRLIRTTRTYFKDIFNN